MKRLRIILIALIVTLLMLFGASSSIVQALSLKNDMTEYTLKNMENNIVTFRSIYDDPDKLKEGLLYCIRGSKAFPSGISENYSEFKDMKTEASAVISKYNELNGVNLDRTETIADSKGESYSVNIYNAILWTMDNSYLPKDNEEKNYFASEYREELLNKIKSETGNVDVLNVTDVELEVAQQAALWFFTDYDKNGDTNSVSRSDRDIADYITKNGANNWANQEAVNSIYNYFIDNALKNASLYGTTDPRDITIDEPELTKGTTTDELSVITKGSAYYIGPFNIEETETGNIEYNLEEVLTIGGIKVDKKSSGVNVYTITKNTTNVKDYNSIKEAVGNGDFYIRIGSLVGDIYNISNSIITLSVDYNYDYYKTTETVLIPENNEYQAVTLIEREKISDEDSLEWTTEKIKVGEFSLNLTKVNSDNEKLAGASFKLEKGTWNGSTFTPAGEAEEFGPTDKVEREILKLIEDQEITKDGDYKPGTYYFRITETETPTGYFGLKNPLIIKVVITETDDGFSVDAKLINSENNEVSSIENVASLTLDNNTISLIVKNEKKKFDVSLRKYIIEKNGEAVSTREPNIDCEPLDGETGTTAIYKHRKDPVEVKAGDTVTYRIETYNEGNVKGYIYTIKDYLPQYLEFIPNSDFISYEDYEELTETTAASVTAKYVYKYDEENYILEILNYSNPFIKGGLMNYLWKLDEYNGETLDRNHIDLTFKVKEDFVPEEDTYLTNVATMTYGDALVHSNRTEERDSNKGGTDHLTEQFTEPDQSKLVSKDVKAYIGDSNENKDKPLGDSSKYFVGQQDDDDFEKLVIKGKRFDLSLRKFITKVGETEENPSRVPKIKILGLKDGSDKTAKYVHPKNTLSLKRGDLITYTIRVYNEGEIDGKVKEITDYLPEGLELVETEDTAKYNWTAGTPITKEGKTLTPITTDFLKNSTLKAYDKEKESGDSAEWWKAEDDNTGLYYFDVQVACKIKDSVKDNEILKNIAEITDYEGGIDKDNEDKVFDDDEHNPGEDDDGYTPGEEDDDDFEKVLVKRFDLSLRKFITKVGETEVSPSRVPQIKILDLKNGKDTTAIYIHPKDTLHLKRGDVITYTIRVYNEGEIDGKVKEITDYLPEGLELVETEDTAKYNWTAGTPITKEGKTLTPITTDFLKDSILKAYDKEKESGDSAEWWKATDDSTGLYYFDVQVACKIKDSVEDNKAIKNIAEITDYEGGIDKDNEEKVFDDGEHTPGTDDHGYTPGEEDDDDFEEVDVVKEQFDLALRKYITAVQNSEGITKAITNKDGEANTRSLNNINKDPLVTGGTTAEYKHRKDPVLVENGDIVTYTLKVYNEGDINGSVTEIKDKLPDGLEFIEPKDSSTTNTEFVKKGTSNTGDAKYEYSIEDGVLTIKPISGKEAGTVFEELTAFNKTTKELDSASIEFKCKVNVVVSNGDKVLTNIALISGDKAAGANPDKLDRDSEPETKPNEFDKPSNSEELENYKGKTTDKVLSSEKYYEGQQDDDDFEKLIIVGKNFDLSLRKFITGINGTELDESETRKPLLDMTPLEDNDSTTTTARYEHTKNSVIVKQGDIVTYTIRVYNEGERNGYATEVTDYLPEGLGFIVGYKTNADNCWGLEEGTTSKSLKDFKDACEVTKANLKLTDFDPAEGITSLDNVQIVTGKVKIKSTLLNSKLINAYDKTKTSKASEAEKWQKAMDGKGTTGLYYEDIEVACVVLAPNTFKGTLKNIAEITSAKDENNVEIKKAGDDVDSIPNTVDETKYHNSSEDHGYWPGEEDDDDFEPLKLQYFDLALRKFITAVNSAEITSRVPVLSIDEATGNIKYTHPKAEAPVEVENGNEVTYTLRIFNEGTRDGYADLVADDIPEGLVFLPENSINKEYRWVMYKRVDIKDKEDYPAEEITVIDGVRYIKTDDPSEADVIQTDYLSKEQGELRKGTPDAENPALLSGYDNSKGLSVTNPDNADIKVVFKVVEPNTSNRVVINSAQITHDTDDKGREVDDNDSETNKWNEGEDDQDKEYIKVKYFDLSLYKWVTKAIVMVDDEVTTTETGFKPNIGKTINIAGMDVRENSEKEPIAVVSLDKKKLSSTTVWFAYNITVMNEGEIAGSATEITDYIPEGLEFVEEDNYEFGWESAGDGKITTRCLDGLVLQPGESATVEVVFRWINSSDNLGLKTNIAEISEDFNESGSEDIDSITDNKYDDYTEEQEDDDDFALVMLQLDTGSLPTYIMLVTIVLTILAGGTILIKKYVL